MALIICSDCKSEVSSNAISCPKCGNPINTTNIENSVNQNDSSSVQKVIVEGQVKKEPWNTKILGSILCFVALPVAMSGNIQVGAACFGIGITLFIIGRFGD